MQKTLASGLLAATRLTKAGQLTQATAVVQRLLTGGRAQQHIRAPRGPSTIDGVTEAGELATDRTALMRGFLGAAGHRGFQLPDGALPHLPSHRAAVSVPDGANFLTATFSNSAGSRPYKLYVPSSYHGQPAPLIVMLHGCTQSPDDFAAGTRMNEIAEAQTYLVAYPVQTSAANPKKCWNWYSESDQRRDSGEPSLIAGITRQVMRDYAVDPRRIYVAGLSAGGAAAAVMGEVYPDLYAAVGVHSGLACGAAHDMPSAFAAMRNGSDGTTQTPTAQSGTPRRIVPTIVFHGDRDTTVSPRNGEAVVAQAARAAALRTRTEEGRVPGGHAYRRTRHVDADGQTVIEQWLVHGAGHAWFGGSPAGSYTDPHGPDATAKIVRFFMEHPHPMAARTD